MTPITLINKVRDEADAQRATMEYLFRSTDYEKKISQYSTEVKKTKRKTLHGALSALGLSELTNAQRHKLFDRLFNRRMSSLDEITNIEVTAFWCVVMAEKSSDNIECAAQAIKEIAGV